MENDERPAGQPHQLGDLIIREKIGEGASAEVYLVDHAVLGGSAALKWWRHPLSVGEEQRFVAECQLQKQLSDHPNIVRIQWAEAPAGARPWLVTDLYDESLLDRLSRGPQLTLTEALAVADGTLAGLAEVHRLKHVHRDVKPANVLLKDGVPALGDLGITMLVGSQTVASVAGTVGYRAPELALGSSPTYRSDVYSAGMTLRAVFGQDCPVAIDDLLTRATSHRPDDRPADAAAFRSALSVAQLLPIDPTPVEPVPALAADDHRAHRARRRPRRAVAVLAAAAVVTGLTASGVYAAQGSAHVPAWLSSATGARELGGAGTSTVGVTTAPPSIPAPGVGPSPSPSPLVVLTPTSSPVAVRTSVPRPTPSATPSRAPSASAETSSPSSSPSQAQPSRPPAHVEAPVRATITSSAPKRCDRSPKLSGIPKASSDPSYVVRGAFPCKPSAGRSRLVVIQLSGIDPSNPHREYYLKWFVPASNTSWAKNYDASHTSDPGEERAFFVTELTARQLSEIRASDRRVQGPAEGYYGGDGDDPVGDILDEARTSPVYPTVWTG